jgi:dTMP kinase
MSHGHISYVAFDGIDGAGKSLQVLKLCENLRRLNYTPIHLIEPTYGRYGREIRERMLNGDELSAEEQRELFTADRKQHVEFKINPLLNLVKQCSPHGGFVIVQDRSYYSAPAYQASGEAEMIQLLTEQQAIAPKPDLVILIDVPVEVAVERIRNRQDQSCIFEKCEILRKVRQNFQFIGQYESRDKVVIIDGEGEVSEISQRVLALLDLSPFDP